MSDNWRQMSANVAYIRFDGEYMVHFKQFPMNSWVLFFFLWRRSAWDDPYMCGRVFVSLDWILVQRPFLRPFRQKCIPNRMHGILNLINIKAKCRWMSELIGLKSRRSSSTLTDDGPRVIVTKNYFFKHTSKKKHAQFFHWLIQTTNNMFVQPTQTSMRMRI